MNKIALIAVFLLPCLPSLIMGIESQKAHDKERKIELLEPRFERWCLANGIGYYNLSTKELDIIWNDQWSETDDFCAAVDSVDSVLNVTNNILNNP